MPECGGAFVRDVHICIYTNVRTHTDGRMHFHMYVRMKVCIKIVSEYDQEILQSQTADYPMAPRGRVHSTITRHQEDKLSKATSSLFPIKMIAILDWT